MHSDDPGLVLLHQLRFKETSPMVTVFVKGVSSGFGLVLLMPRVMGHFSIRGSFSADLFQTFRERQGFKIFGQLVSLSLQQFLVHKATFF